MASKHISFIDLQEFFPIKQMNGKEKDKWTEKTCELLH